MADAFTCKSFQIARAPKRIALLGDKTKRPEPAQHIIEFPGGAIEVSRTTNGAYWAHIIVNRGYAVGECEGLRSAFSEIIGARIDRAGVGVARIENAENIEQIAILIRPRSAA